MGLPGSRRDCIRDLQFTIYQPLEGFNAVALLSVL